MTEEELLAKMANHLTRTYFQLTAKEEATQLLAIIEEVGYVKLSPDQTFPIPKDDVHIWWDYNSDWIYKKAQQDMLNAGWRKVKLSR